MADKIPIQCETCSKRFRVSLETAGKMVRCPCGAALRVPAEAPDPRAAKTHAGSMPSPAESPPSPAGDETTPSEPAQGPANESLVRKWYYARDGERFGPVPQSELQRLLEAGEVSPDEFVWGRGMEQWRPAAEVEGFRTAPADSPADEAPTPAADPPSAAETDPTVEGPPACSIQRGFSKAVTLAGAVGFVAGLCGLVDREEPLVVVVGLAIAVAVMGFGQLIGLTIDARRELWHIRHSLKQREEGPDGGEQDEEAEDDSPRAP